MGQRQATRPPRGSSPHTRGTLSRGRWCRNWREDHPRIRGEHRRVLHAVFELVGIIPVYAGNTARQPCASWHRRGSSPHTRGTRIPTNRLAGLGEDHPRIRGEHFLSSSPMTFSEGIIPAYAGNTSRPSCSRTRTGGSSPHTRGTRRPRTAPSGSGRDHPRIRGEHARVLVLLVRLDGIIPAYAGNTRAASDATRACSGSSPHTRGTLGPKGQHPVIQWDHPRIRGEHHAAAPLLRPVAGIIPAYAGNTLDAVELAVSAGGSSPHTRGTRRRRRAAR